MSTHDIIYMKTSWKWENVSKLYYVQKTFLHAFITKKCIFLVISIQQFIGLPCCCLSHSLQVVIVIKRQNERKKGLEKRNAFFSPLSLAFFFSCWVSQELIPIIITITRFTFHVTSAGEEIPVSKASDIYAHCCLLQSCCRMRVYLCCFYVTNEQSCKNCPDTLLEKSFTTMLLLQCVFSYTSGLSL